MDGSVMKVEFVPQLLHRGSQLSLSGQKLRNVKQLQPIIQISTAVPAPPPPLPSPGESATISPGGIHPSEPSIVDFHLPKNGNAIKGGSIIIDRFSVSEVTGTPGPAKLMSSRKNSRNPDIRWIHLPFNSMIYAENAIQKACEDMGLDQDIAAGAFLADDKWADRLHVMPGGAWHHSTYMETTCFEISLDDAALRNLPETERAAFRHSGANMVVFMPFLHWGTEHVLAWRNKEIESIQTVPQEIRCPEGIEEGGEMRDFYVGMMRNQLLHKKPFHLRRTLDQFYYTHAKDTDERDHDQVVSKYGPEPDRIGKRVILIVDQLWLWILGGKTVITCFDRRWTAGSSPKENIFENVLWKLQKGGQAKRIRTAYELAHLIIDEASSFFFSFSKSLNESLRFFDIFRKAITTVNETQAFLFQDLISLNNKPASQLTAREQDRLFDIHPEFQLIREIKDIMDELNIICHIYDEQLSILDTLHDLQLEDTLFSLGHKDAEGEWLHNYADNEDQRLLARFDEREWFKRTSRYMGLHRNQISYMMAEVRQVYDELKDTIDLKQNNANVFEAHESRRESETVMVFTLVSSFMLPLSFFTSIFSMNVREINEGSTITLSQAFTYTIPLSLLLTVLFAAAAFNRLIREAFTRNEIRQGLSRLTQSVKNATALMGNTGHPGRVGIQLKPDGVKSGVLLKGCREWCESLRQRPHGTRSAASPV